MNNLLRVVMALRQNPDNLVCYALAVTGLTSARVDTTPLLHWEKFPDSQYVTFVSTRKAL